MFIIILATILRLYFDKKKVDLRRLVVCSVPAAALFLLIVYANYAVSPQFSVIGGFLNPSSEGFKALFGFASYIDMVVDTIGFFVFCYLPLLPLAILGFKRSGGNFQLSAWVLCVSVALSFAIANVFIVLLPYRWTLLLTYPLAFYATEGFVGLRLKGYKMGVGLMLAILSLGFIFLPNNLALPYYVAFPLYIPTSMLQNTISLSDCQDTANVLQWAKANMNDETRLLTHRVFYSWATLTLDDDQLIHYSYDDPETTAQKLTEDGLPYQLWLIWWVNGSGWYDMPSVSSAFGELIHESGRIAIFTYNDSNHFIAS
jgi:hypothetical protein